MRNLLSNARVALCIALVPVSAPAAQRDGCFCLSNPQYGYFHWGCYTPADADATAVCLTLGDSGPTAQAMALDAAWQRVPSGEGMCTPCMPDIDIGDIPETFRGLYSEDPAPAAGVGDGDE